MYLHYLYILDVMVSGRLRLPHLGFKFVDITVYFLQQCLQIQKQKF